MAQINLLPWREEQRQERTRQFATITGLSLLFTGAMVFAVHVAFNNQINHQQFRNQMLTDQIVTLDNALKEITKLEEKKEELLARMDVIQSLQQRRPQIVHLFDDFVRTVPEGIFLNEISQDAELLTIKGVAESNGRVSAYMRNIDASNWMSTPKLKVIESRQGTLRSSSFTLITSQSLPDDGKTDLNNAEGS